VVSLRLVRGGPPPASPAATDLVAVETLAALHAHRPRPWAPDRARLVVTGHRHPLRVWTRHLLDAHAAGRTLEELAVHGAAAAVACVLALQGRAVTPSLLERLRGALSEPVARCLGQHPRPVAPSAAVPPVARAA
jgi:hypothetical protein